MGAQWLSGRVLDSWPRVRASPASLRCGPWARHIYPSLVLVQPRKTRPCLTERLLMGHKESNQTKQTKQIPCSSTVQQNQPWSARFPIFTQRSLTPVVICFLPSFFITVLSLSFSLIAKWAVLTEVSHHRSISMPVSWRAIFALPRRQYLQIRCKTNWNTSEYTFFRNRGKQNRFFFWNQILVANLH